MRQLFSKKLLTLFIPVIFLVLLNSCEKKENSVIDPSYAPPLLNGAYFSLPDVLTDTMFIGPERKSDDLLLVRGIARVRVSDIDGNDQINSVKCSISKDFYSDPIGESALHDDGIFPDAAAGDSIFSGYLDIQFYRVAVGGYWISYSATNRNIVQGNMIFLSFQIRRQNWPPIISELSAPDTISLSGTAFPFQISVKAIDVNGQSDIRGIFRFTPSGLVKAFQKILNDSIFIEDVDRTGAVPGSFRFRFRAVDWSNDSSNVLFKTIVVVN